MNAAFGRYRLLERLGQGGMAEVFKAKSYGVEGFEKTLVIKRILPELARSPEFVDMFIHEAKLAVRLSHANIVQVFDLGRAAMTDATGSAVGGPAEAYYMAMEYVHGLDLATLLSRARRQRLALPIQMGVYVACEVSKGLDHAHRRRDDQMRPLGIVHRDVSPQNVLLSFEGEVKVTDFGIAKARGALDRSGHDDTHARALQGKFGYMSPEQAQGGSVDARSDIFSAGTVLYECIAGVNPFHAPTTFETLRRVQACEFPPIELLRPEVPPELVAILKTAMAKSPADRYEGAGGMYEALLAFLYSQGSRYGAHDLAEFLGRFREPGERGKREPQLEADAPQPSAERTPVEIPASRNAVSVRMSTSARYVAMGRAADMGERREVTALVFELPRDVPQAVGDHAASTIERWGGRVMRREPGHVAALFGLGDPDGRDTEMATRCALVVLHRAEAPHAPSAGLHIGRIHVTRAGEPNDDERLSTLLATARDLARARAGQTAVSTPAMRQVRALFEFEAIDSTEAFVSNVAAVLVRDTRRAGEVFGRFVGRKDELRRIGELLATATKRTARTLTIRGESGIGKTRLLYEVERRLRKGGYNVGFHIATCLPRGRELPLSGITSMIQVLCGTSEGDSNERLLAVAPRLRALGLQTDEVNVVLTALGAIAPTRAQPTQARIGQAFGRMVQSLCEDRPYAFAWDAAQALDSESLAVLDEVRTRLRQSRLVFAFAIRGDLRHPLEDVDGHMGLELRELDASEAERLVALRVGIDAVPEELFSFVTARAGGHPLFIEEVVKGLLDSEALVVDDRHVILMNFAAHARFLPKTLRGLVASRVARLASPDRATLQAAAVLGDPIELTVLSSMLGESMQNVERSVAALKDREFVVDAGPSELRFVSPVVPEIVADALTPEAAREIHAAAGQALETSFGDRAHEHAQRIATHFFEAGDRERASIHYAKSAERLREARQLEGAARDYARAIALVDPVRHSPEELTEWLAGLAAAVRVVRVLPEAEELCDRVLERVDASTHPREKRMVRVRAHVSAADILTSIQHIDGARRRLTHARDLAGDDNSLLGAVLVAGVELSTRQGDFKQASELLSELDQVVQGASDAREKHRVALLVALAGAGRGDRAIALEKLDQADHMFPDDPIAGIERAKARASVDYLTGDLRGAVAHADDAIARGRELGLSYQVMSALGLLGEVLIELGDMPRAYGVIRQSLELAREMGDERHENHDHMLLAFLDGLNGDGSAEKLLAQGISYAESREFTGDVVGGRQLLAKLLQKHGRLDVAHREYERARVAAARAGQRFAADACERALHKLGAGPPSTQSVPPDATY